MHDNLISNGNTVNMQCISLFHAKNHFGQFLKQTAAISLKYLNETTPSVEWHPSISHKCRKHFTKEVNTKKKNDEEFAL